MERAVLLLSGGLDSTTVLAMALHHGFDVTALSVSYGQRHAYELECAARIAKYYAVRHIVSKVDLQSVGGSALTESTIAVPKGRSPSEMGADIPVSYVPARNTVMLSLALAWAEVLDANAIFMGVNALDYSGYPDCRPEFILAFERMARLATRRAVEGEPITILTPLINMRKREIIAEGLRLGVDYSTTSSCYDPQPAPCAVCDACVLRAEGFEALGQQDPALL